MKVTEWTSWEDNRYEDAGDLPINDFLEIEEVVVEEVKEKGYKFCGSYHQHGVHGCPVVDNEYIYKVSMRKWGDVMALAHNLDNSDGLAYVSWAWSTPQDETPVYPKE